MSAVLVTGGTGQVGRALLPLLHGAGHDVRVASRTPERSARTPGQLVEVDLVTGDGLASALAGVDVVVHLATTNGRRDEEMMRTLIAGVESRPEKEPAHVIYLSIVGSDRIPLPYYRHKTAAEELALRSGLPVTVPRSTQFHSLVERLFSAQHRLPVLLVPAIALQPIHVPEVAARLAELVGQGPSGRVADIGGPETLQVGDLARLWQRVRGRHRPQVPLRLPGRTFAAYRDGEQLVPGPPFGRTTFGEFLAREG